MSTPVFFRESKQTNDSLKESMQQTGFCSVQIKLQETFDPYRLSVIVRIMKCRGHDWLVV